MSKSNVNVITHGFSGKLGDQIVLRQRNGQTILASKPRITNTEPSEAQALTRINFACAVRYAKQVLLDAVTAAPYVAKAGNGLTPFNLAVRDYLTVPIVRSIDATGYNGQPGDKIKVTAIDDFTVISVEVTIEQPDGTVIESGLCIPDQNGVDWHYTVTQANTIVSGQKIVAKVTDTPGNFGTGIAEF